MTSPYETPDEFEPVATASTATRPRFRVRKSAAASGLEASRLDIMAMGRTLADVAERVERLDIQTTSPEAVRRSVLEEVAQRLVDAGDAAGYSIVRAMIREDV